MKLMGLFLNLLMVLGFTTTATAQAKPTFVRCYIGEFGLTQISVYDSTSEEGVRVVQISSLDTQKKKTEMKRLGDVNQERFISGGTTFFTEMASELGNDLQLKVEITPRRVKITDIFSGRAIVDSPIRSCVDGN